MLRSKNLHGLFMGDGKGHDQQDIRAKSERRRLIYCLLCDKYVQ